MSRPRRLLSLIVARIGQDPSPLRRGRLVFLTINLLTLVGMALAAALGHDGGGVPRPLALLSVGVVAWSWGRGFRRGGFARWQDPLEWLALAVTALAVGPQQATGLLFGGLFLRALFVTAPRLALSALVYLALGTATAWAARGLPGVAASLPQGAAMLVTTVGMFVFGRTLRRYEQAMARERALAEEVERRRGEERFRSLVQASSDMILVVGPQDTVAFQSPAAERLLGGASDALVGRPLTDLVSAHDASPLRGGELAALAGHGTFEWLASRVDGTQVELEGVVSDLREDPSVGGLVLTSRDIAERKAFERALSLKAYHDDLTGLPNRSLVLERLQAGATAGDRVAVLYLDLDDFKTVNDSLGHVAGDELVLEVASRLAKVAGDPHDVGRLGGDEFVLLVHAADAAQAAAHLAARVLDALTRPFTVDGHEIRIGASVGIAVGPGEPDDLLRDADAALAAAKGRGKQRYELFEPAMRTAALERLALRAELEGALERDELLLHYQPLVELASGEVVGVEALVRWRHRERGLVAPGTFIPLAEETGLIVPLGGWVLREACRQVRRWQRELPDRPPLRLNVNVSPRQLVDPGLLTDVAEALDASGLDPRHLVLEVTETVLAQNTDLAVDRLRALRHLGVGIAVDDFGTGYSSLRYLQRFPLDMLKIDRSFVADVDDHASSTLARVIVDLAAALGLETVAEGIEHPEQGRVLHDLGCQLGQGFHFSRPVEPRALRALLEHEVAPRSLA